MALLLAGDGFIILLLLFAGIAFPTLLIGGIIYVLLRAEKSKKVWAQYASMRGLHQPEPGKLRIEGVFDGIPTSLFIEIERRSDGERTRVDTFTACYAKFPKNMRFGLDIAGRGGLQLFDVGRRMPVGHPMDAQFRALAYDHEVLRHFLVTEFGEGAPASLADDLVAAKREYPTITITDKGIKTRVSGTISTDEKLDRIATVTAKLARRFMTARSLFPKTRLENDLEREWAGFASQRGLGFDPENLTIEGLWRGYPIRIEAYTELSSWITKFSIRYPRPLMMGISLTPEYTGHIVAKLLGYQDLKTGNPEFDKNFIVQAKNVQAALHKLDQATCVALLEAKRHSKSLKLDDEGLEIEFERVVVSSVELGSFLDALLKPMNRLM